MGKHLCDGDIKYPEYSNVKNKTKYSIPNTTVNKLTILAYFADDPNRNDEKKPRTETINICSGSEYPLINSSMSL